MKLTALTDAQLKVITNNFNGKIDKYAATLQITAEEIATSKADDINFSYALDMQDQVKKYGKTWTTFKTALRTSEKQENMVAFPEWSPLPALNVPVAGVAVRFGKFVQRIQGHPAYTLAIGQDLGIESITNTTNPIDPDTMQPVIKIKIVAGQPILSWKKGKTSGIELQKAIGSTGDYQPVSIILGNSYTDKSQLPAPGQSVVWKYKAIYRLKDERIGLWSSEVSVSVMG